MKHAIARKRSDDPANEHLKEQKAQWNTTVSSFIEKAREFNFKLIALKRAINGFPVPEFGIQDRTDIKYPLPESVSQIIDGLAGEYQTLSQEFSRITQDGKGIIQEQAQYSQNRRKSVAEGGEPTPPPQMQMAANLHSEITKEASNVFTRLYTYIKTPFMFSDEDRWARKNMLQTTAQLQRILIQIGENIVSRSPTAIPEAVNLTTSFINHFYSGVVEPLSDLNDAKKEEQRAAQPEEEKSEEKSEEPEEDEKEEELSEEPPLSERGPEAQWHEAPTPPDINQDDKADSNERKMQLREWVNDLRELISQDRLQVLIADLKMAGIDVSDKLGELGQNEIAFYEKARNILMHEDFTENDYNEIYNHYQDIIARFKSLEDAARQAGVVASLDPAFQKYAQSRTGRWINRQWLNILRTEDYRIRMKLDGLITEADDKLDRFMNTLQQKNAPLNVMTDQVIEFGLLFNKVLNEIHRLASNYNSQARIRRLKDRASGKRSTLDIIDRAELTRIQNMRNDFVQLKEFIRKEKKDEYAKLNKEKEQFQKQKEQFKKQKETFKEQKELFNKKQRESKPDAA